MRGSYRASTIRTSDVRLPNGRGPLIETAESYREVRAETDAGPVLFRHYPVFGSEAAAVFVGGAGGGWDTPARGLYPWLCEELGRHGVACLRVRFRDPRLLDGCVLDVLAGLAYLREQGSRRIALVGHSLGGAVVISAAAASKPVRTVVALSTQSYGADAAARLAPDCSILLVHGKEDRVLPWTSSQYVSSLAGEPRKLVLYDGAGHGLDEVASELRELIRGWILREVGERSPGP